MAKFDKQMEVDEYIKLNSGLTTLMAQLYGQDDYHSFKDWTRLNSYKKQLLKLLRTLDTVISVNLDSTDYIHEKRIKEQIERVSNEIKKSKNIDEINQNFIEAQTRIMFYILGQHPQNFMATKKITNSKFNWKLNEYRTLSYSQDELQKTSYLINLITDKRLGEDFPDYRTLMLNKIQDDEYKYDDFLL